MVVIHSHCALHHDYDHYHCGSRLPESPNHRHKSSSTQDEETPFCKRKEGKGWGIARKVGKMQHVIHALREETEAHNRAKLCMRTTLVVLCGCTSVMTCELIIKKDQKGMDLITVFSYLLSIVLSFSAGGPALVTKRQIPLKYHMATVFAFFGYNWCTNLGFGMGLPMPIALVVKNGGLLCQMLVGVVVVGEMFSTQQVIAALLVTVGILITVWSTMKDDRATEDDQVGLHIILPGVGMMLAAMLSRSLGNLASQSAFNQYGKQYNEAMFYQHALGLPLLLFGGQTLLRQAMHWTNDLTENVGGVVVPVMWIYLLCTMVMNYITTFSCAEVTGLSNPVMLNLVLTCQRFVSIVVSAVFFNAPPWPPATMWLGACLVVGGCVMYILL